MMDPAARDDAFSKLLLIMILAAIAVVVTHVPVHLGQLIVATVIASPVAVWIFQYEA